eukprot:scaffold198729_cov35-Tisochrysis_lutea.AAC.1
MGALRGGLLLFGLCASAAAASPARAAPPPPPIAKNLGDVVSATVGSFLSIGSIGFIFTAAQESMARASVAGAARKAVPRFVLRASLINAQRWGRVTAGFAGGRAVGQVWRGVDDQVCSICGAIAGGAAAASSVADIPSSVLTFVAFSYALDKLTGGSSEAAGTRELAPKPTPKPPSLTPGQRLDKLLGIQA